MTNNSNPSILWAQDRNYLFLTLEVLNIKQQNIVFEINSILFKASSKYSIYDINIELFGDIVPSKCNWNIRQNCVKLVLKKEKNFFWNRLTKTKQNNVKIDWSKWINEEDSESEEENEMINNFNDFKKNIPSEILEKDFKELFSPDEELSNEISDSDNDINDNDINDINDNNINDNDINNNNISDDIISNIGNFDNDISDEDISNSEKANDSSYDASGEQSISITKNEMNIDNIENLNLDDELDNCEDNVGLNVDEISDSELFINRRT